MEEQFYLKIYLFRPNRLAPIKIARDSQLRITVETMDYTIPDGATAAAYACGSGGKVYRQDCSVDGNKISFVPQAGFFVPGKNQLQYEINNGVIPLAIDVNCEISLPDGGEATTPEQVLPYVTRAENAALRAEEYRNDAAEIATDAEQYARKAAESLETVLEKEASARSAAEEAAQSLVDANAAKDGAEQYAAEAKDFANTAAGYAGAATVSIGWDADGYFSIFEQEE